MHRVDRGLALPALAAQLGLDRGLALRDGFGNGRREIEVPTDTRIIRAINAKDRPGIVEIWRKPNLTVF